MVGRIALRSLLRLLTGTRKEKRWAELKYLLKNHLFTGRTAAKGQDPLPPLLFQMASGYWLSQALYVAAKLGIADLLKDGAKSSAELATATCSEPSAVFRVLRALSSA